MSSQKDNSKTADKNKYCALTWASCFNISEVKIVSFRLHAKSITLENELFPMVDLPAAKPKFCLYSSDCMKSCTYDKYD